MGCDFDTIFFKSSISFFFKQNRGWCVLQVECGSVQACMNGSLHWLAERTVCFFMISLLLLFKTSRADAKNWQESGIEHARH